jgi:hypothetical protein
MSTLKTSANATLPKPIVSPGRELRRRQAKGHEMVATAQSRGARQAKERTMPKKPKPEPKVDEPKKPYEATPLENDAKERVVARCAQKRGRAPGFRMSEEHRGKIKNSSILNALIEHVQGEREMSATQVSAGLGLLKKVLPDLQSVTLAGDHENPLVHESIGSRELWSPKERR